MLDASWSPCGLRLAACSWDGTAVFIEFTQQELGQPLDPAEQVNMLHIYIYTTYANYYYFCITYRINYFFPYVYRVVYMNDCTENHWFKEVVW